jgi:hypothetical protein
MTVLFTLEASQPCGKTYRLTLAKKCAGCDFAASFAPHGNSIAGIGRPATW